VRITTAFVYIFTTGPIRTEFVSGAAGEQISTDVRSGSVATFLCRQTHRRSIDTLVYIDTIADLVDLVSMRTDDGITVAGRVVETVSVRTVLRQTSERSGDVVTYTRHVTVVSTQLTLVVIDTDL